MKCRMTYLQICPGNDDGLAVMEASERVGSVVDVIDATGPCEMGTASSSEW